jgi:hypothetical protein
VRKFYNFVLLIFLFSSCNQIEKQQAGLNITHNDVSSVYSLALDSLLGPSDKWLDTNPLLIGDSIVIEVIFNEETMLKHFYNQLLSDERYCPPKKCLEIYDGFDKTQFEAILADSSFIKFYDKGGSGIKSSYKYKVRPVNEIKAAYVDNEPLAGVSFSKIAFNKEVDYAIILASFSKVEDWGAGKAIYLRKERSKWGVVGVNRLFTN